ncbi:uncharacterized protein LOC115584563 isoform X4 [Sparus aurata]|uniref:uncharacterized protein LOC115584563 isoform X4 n=1 Tax=Sparus aurata TaxID=8175 RepID=UPI0011C0F78D|nr:uncharacterized protein LOC115584563 isoform X4 [Sparus aurata]
MAVYMCDYIIDINFLPLSSRMQAVRVKYRDRQKYICYEGQLTFKCFLECVAKKFDIPTLDVKVYDDSKTEIDEEAFEFLVKSQDLGVLEICLPVNPSLDDSLSSSASCSFESISGDKEGDSDSTIILQPSPTTRRANEDASLAQEHFYNAQDGSGYLAWRLKFVQKEASEGPKRTGRQSPTQRSGPEGDREPFVEENWLNTDTLCSEATALMKHTVDEAVVKEKMKQTFTYRQKMVHDPVKSSDIFTAFPRFLDIAGLIEQDFSLMFGDAVSARFLEKWPTVYKRKNPSAKPWPHADS